jgi:hypothetical protein
MWCPRCGHFLFLILWSLSSPRSCCIACPSCQGVANRIFKYPCCCCFHGPGLSVVLSWIRSSKHPCATNPFIYCTIPHGITAAWPRILQMTAPCCFRQAVLHPFVCLSSHRLSGAVHVWCRHQMRVNVKGDILILCSQAPGGDTIFRFSFHTNFVTENGQVGRASFASCHCLARECVPCLTDGRRVAVDERRR